MLNYHDRDFRSLSFYNEAQALKITREELLQICTVAEIDPKTVKLVLELGCGYGRITKPLLDVFSNATIQAVDADDRLGGLKNNPRLQFFQGQFVDVLQSGKVYPPDILTMINMGAGHGFTKDTVHLLKRFGAEKIITEGDNAGLEFKPWFTDKFQVTLGPNDIEPGNFNFLGWRVIQKK